LRVGLGFGAVRVHAVDAGLDAREIGGRDVDEPEPAAWRKPRRVGAAAAEARWRVAPDDLRLCEHRPRVSREPQPDAERSVDLGDVGLQYEVEPGRAEVPDDPFACAFCAGDLELATLTARDPLGSLEAGVMGTGLGGCLKPGTSRQYTRIE